MTSMTLVNNITKQIIDNVIVEIKREENMDKIKLNIIDPIIHYSIERIYPFIIFSGAVFVLTLLVAIVILIILIRGK